MPLERVEIQGLVDSATGNLVALFAPGQPNGRQFPLSSGGAGGVVAPLAADHVITSQDDGVIYYVSAPVVVTWTDGLNPKPNVGFVCPLAGSITVRMAGSATHDGGSTADVVKNLTTDPGGFSVGPATIPTDMTSNDYTVSAGLVTFASLGGSALANGSLVAQFPQIAAMGQYAIGGMQGRQRVSLTTSLTLDPAQCVPGGLYPAGTTFRNISGNDRTITLPTGMPLNYWFETRMDSASAVACIIAKSGGGVGWNPRVVGGSNALRITLRGGSGIVRMFDVDNWEFLGSDWVV